MRSWSARNSGNDEDDVDRRGGGVRSRECSRRRCVVGSGGRGSCPTRLNSDATLPVLLGAAIQHAQLFDCTYLWWRQKVAYDGDDDGDDVSDRRYWFSQNQIPAGLTVDGRYCLTSSTALLLLLYLWWKRKTKVMSAVLF